MILALIGACDPPKMSENGVVAVIGRTGLGDGEFNYPRAITTSPDGDFFVVDKTGRIQRFGADGALEKVWQMPETAAGKPVGLSIHPDGRLLIPDTHYFRVMITDHDGTELARFGKQGMGEGEFQLPTDVAVDAEGNYYVGEYHLNDRITKWSPDRKFIQEICAEPVEGKPLARPAGVMVDDEQTLWIADACNHRLIRTTLDGEVLTVFGEYGEQPGQMKYPYDLNLTPDNQLLVCEYGGNRLQWFAKDGRSLRVWGGPGRAPGEVSAPWGAAYGADGRIYLVDSRNDRVQIIAP